MNRTQGQVLLCHPKGKHKINNAKGQNWKGNGSASADSDESKPLYSWQFP